MVSRCSSIRRRKNQSTTSRQERAHASHSAQFLAALHLKSTATFSKKRKRPGPESPDQPHPKRAALNRTLSAPSQLGIGNLNRQSPNASPASSSQQPFCRSLGPPALKSYLPVAGKPAPLPPRSREPSPDAQMAKRLQRMMILMSKQLDEYIKESSSSEDAESQNNDQFPDKSDSEASQESVTEGTSQESLWVEKTGELVTVHLKCPCTQGYKVLLRGDVCYYQHASF